MQELIQINLKRMGIVWVPAAEMHKRWGIVPLKRDFLAQKGSIEKQSLLRSHW